MTTESQTQSTTLYYKAGGSDKVYRAAIEPSGTGFVVNFAYGRRGSTLQTGYKTASPVAYDAARKIFDKLVQEKTAKGYTPGEDGTPYQHTAQESRVTGILPQLLNAIEEDQAQPLLTDPAWWAQEKFDGKRILIRKAGDQVTGINRKGLIVALAQPLVEAARATGGGQWIIDGEAIGETLVAFDLLEQACVDVRSQPYSRRLKALAGTMINGNILRIAETATTTAAKRALLARLRQENREGIVFKRHAAAYAPDRPASGGDQLKLKFTATASCLVMGTNGSKRSVSLGLLDGKNRIGVGSVTIPANASIPVAGTIVEIRYLYAHFGGSLFQPVYLGARDDLAESACVIGQLKYKRAEDDETP